MDDKVTDIQPVEKGGASVRKKSEMRKAADSFIVEDAKTVGAALIKDIIIPAIKSTLSTLGKTAIDMFLYGKAEKPPTTRSTYSNPSYKRTAYERTDSIDTKRIVKGGVEYDEIEYDSYDRAEEVRLDLIDRIKQSGAATIAELYEFSGLRTDNHTHNRWGWSNLSGTSIKTIYEDGERKYLIKLPRPIQIDWIE